MPSSSVSFGSPSVSTTSLIPNPALIGGSVVTTYPTGNPIIATPFNPSTISTATNDITVPEQPKSNNAWKYILGIVVIAGVLYLIFRKK